MHVCMYAGCRSLQSLQMQTLSAKSTKPSTHPWVRVQPVMQRARALAAVTPSLCCSAAYSMQASFRTSVQQQAKQRAHIVAAFEQHASELAGCPNMQLTAAAVECAACCTQHLMPCWVLLQAEQPAAGRCLQYCKRHVYACSCCLPLPVPVPASAVPAQAWTYQMRVMMGTSLLSSC